MNWWQRLWSRGRMEEQLERELRFHLDEHVADPFLERQVGPALAVQMADLAPAEPELDPAEAMRVRGDALPRGHLPLDPPGDILHGCRSTSDSAICRESATSCTATTARF